MKLRKTAFPHREGWEAIISPLPSFGHLPPVGEGRLPQLLRKNTEQLPI